MATATFTLILPAIFSQEGDWIVASFPDLDVTSQGRTRDEAKRNLIEAAQLFIESCFERNVLEQVLKGCGFTLAHGARVKPKDGEHLTVPVELLATYNGSAAHAG